MNQAVILGVGLLLWLALVAPTRADTNTPSDIRPVLALSTNDVNPRSVHVVGGKNPNVMFHFRTDAPPQLHDFFHDNGSKYIQVTVDGVHVCEKACHAPITGTNDTYVGYDIVTFNQEDAERIAKALRGK